MKQIITKSLQDILSPSVIIFVIKIALLSIGATLLASWALWDILLGLIHTYMSWIPWGWLSKTVTSLASVVTAYTLFIIMVSLFTSLMSEKLIVKLANKHYPSMKVVGSASIKTSVAVTLQATGIFLMLFLLLLPLLFIPILGQIVMLYLWSILLKSPTVYDVGSLFISDSQELKTKSKRATLIAMIGALFNYIPLLNLFAPVFAQVLFLHYLANQKK